MQWLLLLGAEVGGEEAVELASCVLAGARRTGEADGVVDDVVGVDGDGVVDVAGALGLQVPLDEGAIMSCWSTSHLRIGQLNAASVLSS